MDIIQLPSQILQMSKCQKTNFRKSAIFTVHTRRPTVVWLADAREADAIISLIISLVA